MKRRVEDPELVFAPQQQQSRRPPVQGTADSFQHRALAPAQTVIEASADNMQPSTGIQYSLPQGYQVWRLIPVDFKLALSVSWSHGRNVKVLLLKVAVSELNVNSEVYRSVLSCPLFSLIVEICRRHRTRTSVQSVDPEVLVTSSWTGPYNASEHRWTWART